MASTLADLSLSQKQVVFISMEMESNGVGGDWGESPTEKLIQEVHELIDSMSEMQLDAAVAVQVLQESDAYGEDDFYDLVDVMMRK